MRGEEKARLASRENAARRGGVREARRRSTSKRGSPSKELGGFLGIGLS